MRDVVVAEVDQEVNVVTAIVRADTDDEMQGRRRVVHRASMLLLSEVVSVVAVVLLLHLRCLEAWQVRSDSLHGDHTSRPCHLSIHTGSRQPFN